MSAEQGRMPATETPSGRTSIAEAAVAKVVGGAARSVPGVYSLGTGLGAGRAMGALREVVGAVDLTQGIRVEVGETQVAVDCELVADDGFPLQALAHEVRVAVYRAVAEQTGLQVVEVNVEIMDVHIPDPLRPASGTKAGPKPRLSERLGLSERPGQADRPALSEPSGVPSENLHAAIDRERS